MAHHVLIGWTLFILTSCNTNSGIYENSDSINDQLYVENSSDSTINYGPDSSTMIQKPVEEHRIDTAKIKANRSSLLSEFKYSRIDWTKADLQNGEHRKPQPLTIRDTIWSDSTLLVDAVGYGPGGAGYIGNIEVTNGTIYLYYWSDPSTQISTSMFRWNFIYTISGLSRGAYKMELIWL